MRLFARPIEHWPKAVFKDKIYRPWLPGLPIFLMDPAAIREVLVEQSDAFPHGALFRRVMRPVWGHGLLTANGAEWRWQRRASAPAFRPSQMAALAPRMRQVAEVALLRWRAAPAATIWNVAAETGQIALEIILDAVLSGGEDLDRGAIREEIAAFTAQLGRMRLSYLVAPDAFHEARATPLSDHARRLRATVDRMISRRRRSSPRGDLVDLLMNAEDPETGRVMDDATLRDNLLGLIVAGHETSAVTLAWALYLVSQDASTAGRLRGEIEEVTAGAPIDPQHVERLVFTRQVIQETMRLYPPAQR